jgi:hypothetical protein
MQYLCELLRQLGILSAELWLVGRTKDRSGTDAAHGAAACHANTAARAVANAGKGMLASNPCRHVESEMAAASDCPGIMFCLLPDRGRKVKGKGG